MPVAQDPLSGPAVLSDIRETSVEKLQVQRAGPALRGFLHQANQRARHFTRHFFSSRVDLAVPAVFLILKPRRLVVPLGLGNEVAKFVVGQPKDKLKPAVQVGAQGGFKRRVGEVCSRVARDAAVNELGINLTRDGGDLRQQLAMAEQLNVFDFGLEIVAGSALEFAEAGKVPSRRSSYQLFPPYRAACGL